MAIADHPWVDGINAAAVRIAITVLAPGNHAEATTDIADYIVGFYNSVRLHSKLGNLPPNAFEPQSAIKQAIAISEKT